ncbi:stomatin family protein [Niveomyces insectorum RCEF 264]|uniref:Stomatin family protein n=1 Tax=Niveomyces insectorum RCEF 264 TaxID=1081102 RepID=A0A167ST11_9HYPO|nr:stomatin family protein [Niveomyces insectorum RCEF 264]
MSCPDCFAGAVHEGKPRGEIIKLHGLDTYATRPADGRTARAIIVIVSDGFGWEFVNNRLLADHYADKGDYTVYLPDFMEGHAAPLSMLNSMRGLQHGSLLAKPLNLGRVITGFVPFLYHNRIGKSYPRVEAFFRALRTVEGPATRIGAAGFCWGGKHALLMSHGVAVGGDGDTKTQALIDAAFVGHPSFVALPADVEPATVTVPVAFAIGSLDPTLSAAQVAEIQAAVTKQPDAARGEVRIYDGCGHGFCVRADSSLNDVSKQAAAAEDQCIAWFNKHFSL